MDPTGDNDNESSSLDESWHSADDRGWKQGDSEKRRLCQLSETTETELAAMLKHIQLTNQRNAEVQLMFEHFMVYRREVSQQIYALEQKISKETEEKQRKEAETKRRVEEWNQRREEETKKCKLCTFAIEMEVEKLVNKVFDCPNCGAKFCRICERRWDDEHFGHTCKELDEKQEKEAKDKKDRKLEKQINEAVIRKCPRCGLAFMKADGCNKMTCRCGTTQCYICRESNIDYDHFCQHVSDPDVPNWKCNQCAKKCLLHQDANKIDTELIEQMRKGQDEAGEGTSQQ